jgi:hypothetical protein
MAAATFVVGVTDGAGSVIWGTLLQRRVPREMLGRVSSLDFFVSLAFMPMPFAIAGPLSKVVPMEPVALEDQAPNSGGSASTMTRPQKKWVSMGASTPPVIRRS